MYTFKGKDGHCHLLESKRTVPDERQGKTDASRREHDFCLQRYICWSLMSIIKQISARDAHKCCRLRKNRVGLFLIRAPMPLFLIIIIIISFHISIIIMRVREKLFVGPVPRSVSKYLALNLIECWKFYQRGLCYERIPPPSAVVSAVKITCHPTDMLLSMLTIIPSHNFLHKTRSIKCTASDFYLVIHMSYMRYIV